MKKWIFSLLNNDWNAKLLDFGVARLGLQEGFTHISTKLIYRMFSAQEIKGKQGFDLNEIVFAGDLSRTVNSQENPYMVPTLAPRLWPFLSVIQPFAHWRKLPRERSVIQVEEDDESMVVSR
ncbi:hypothetical protein HanPI659440_Chr04g0165871 [Helianthus annuus]|nr:hypothetical protein HanPI659440_Chr04g0165871 [Helianthus annuus]